MVTISRWGIKQFNKWKKKVTGDMALDCILSLASLTLFAVWLPWADKLSSFVPFHHDILFHLRPRAMESAELNLWNHETHINFSSSKLFQVFWLQQWKASLSQLGPICIALTNAGGPKKNKRVQKGEFTLYLSWGFIIFFPLVLVFLALRLSDSSWDLYHPCPWFSGLWLRWYHTTDFPGSSLQPADCGTSWPP